MAIARMTSADVLAVNSSEAVVGLISELSVQYPELMLFPASPVAKTSYKTLVKTANPSVGFRAENAGREHQKATLVARSVDCKFLDASWSIDERQAKECEWGIDAACAIQAESHMESALGAIASQTWYGTGADANGFAGISTLVDGLSDATVVNAGGTGGGSTYTSLYAVRFGVKAVQYAWGGGGSIDSGPRQYTQIFDGAGASFWGYAQAISGWVGLQITNHLSVGRIANVDASNPITDDGVAELLSKFPIGQKPDALFTSQAGLEGLRKSRTATNATGAPAETPTVVHGVPIHATDAILNTEAEVA